MAHALLSPSRASRWLACTPSARFEADFDDRSSEAAEEGTLAHAVGELLIKHRLKLITKAKHDVQYKELSKHKFFNADLYGYATDYADFVIERYAEALRRSKDAEIHLETKLDLTEYVPEGFGTGDCVIISDGVLEIIDLKYGKGVKVEATSNKQMMCYGLGALKANMFMYDIREVRMTIYQPRLDNFGTYTMTADELLAWGENELKPKAEKAYKGEGDYATGGHCQFCKARGVCKALADEMMQLAKYDFEVENRMSDEDIADVLTKAAPFRSWLTAVEDYALAEALKGKKWPGFKLVEGKSNRKYADENAIYSTLKEKGFAPELITEPSKPLAITKLEKAIGKEVFQTLVSPYVVKPQGAPTLVSVEDKRPALNSTDAAIADFSN